ncbi:hypothetical protein [Jannaschia sp. R86511]|uniref:hypothetical protein n=1 Tax=Jannaschia sp. R86511 TaxID=3093853 RepID=UPI0036D2C897
MVNKPNLNNEIDWYEKAQDRVNTLWSEQYGASNHGKTFDMKMSSALALIACVQNWELLLSRWHIRAIVRDSSEYRKFLTASAANLGLSGTPAQLHTAGYLATTLHIPSHLTIRQVEAMLDARDRNVTFKSKRDAMSLSARRLAPPHMAKMRKITDDDWRLLSLAQSVRNAIAHGSGQSLREMNAAIQDMKTSTDPTDASLGGRKTSVQASGIGTYLYSYFDHSLGSPLVRLTYICSRMRNIGTKLR